MKRVNFALLTLALVTGWASPGWAVGLTLTIHEGRVSLDAQDVTIRQILTEWARVGKTQIANLERVNSGPVTLKFDGIPEDEALEIILRTVPGYWAAPRRVLMADASKYDRIGLMTTATTSVAPGARGATQPQPFQDYSANVTQLRATPPPLNPGLLPEPPDDPRDTNDPAIAAAAARGLMPAPSMMPGSVAPPAGPLQPPVRSGAAPAISGPTPQISIPAGTTRPGLAPPPPPPSSTAPVGATRPQQADQ